MIWSRFRSVLAQQCFRQIEKSSLGSSSLSSAVNHTRLFGFDQRWAVTKVKFTTVLYLSSFAWELTTFTGLIRYGHETTVRATVAPKTIFCGCHFERFVLHNWGTLDLKCWKSDGEQRNQGAEEAEWTDLKRNSTGENSAPHRTQNLLAVKHERNAQKYATNRAAQYITKNIAIIFLLQTPQNKKGKELINVQTFRFSS